MNLQHDMLMDATLAENRQLRQECDGLHTTIAQQAREVERLRTMLDEQVSVFHEHPCHCEVCMVIHPPTPCCGDAGDCAEPCGTGGKK